MHSLQCWHQIFVLKIPSLPSRHHFLAQFTLAGSFSEDVILIDPAKWSWVPVDQRGGGGDHGESEREENHSHQHPGALWQTDWLGTENIPAVMAQWTARAMWDHIRAVSAAPVWWGPGGLIKNWKWYIQHWNFYTGLFPLNNITMHYMEDEESNK